MFGLDDLKKLLSQNNLLLENIFSQLSKEFNRTWYPIALTVDIPLSTANYTQIATKKEFPFSYLITSISLLAETNALAGLKLRINGKMYPELALSVDGSNDFVPNTTEGFRANATLTTIYDFNLFVDKPFYLEIFGVNTHTVAQSIYLIINGWIIDLKEVLKVIDKNKVRY